MQRATSSTNEYAGDGTTTSTVLVNHILKEGIKVIENGAHPMQVKEGLELAARHVIQYINSKATPLASPDQLYSICNVSSNYDCNIADSVCSVLSEVGLDSNVELDISPDHRTFMDVQI